MSQKRFDEKLLEGKGYVPDGKGGFITKAEARQLVKSDTVEKPKATGHFQNVKKNAAGMNKTEGAYALHLDARKMVGEVIEYWFEGVTLKLAHDTRLTPDFAVQLRDGSMELHDVKGSLRIYTDDAKVKMKVAARMYPFHFFVVFPRTQKLDGGWDIHRVKP